MIILIGVRYTGAIAISLVFTTDIGGFKSEKHKPHSINSCTFLCYNWGTGRVVLRSSSTLYNIPTCLPREPRHTLIPPTPLIFVPRVCEWEIKFNGFSRRAHINVQIHVNSTHIISFHISQTHVFIMFRLWEKIICETRSEAHCTWRAPEFFHEYFFRVDNIKSMI